MKMSTFIYIDMYISWMNSNNLHNCIPHKTKNLNAEVLK